MPSSQIQGPMVQLLYQTPPFATATTPISTPTRHYDNQDKYCANAIINPLNCCDNPFFQGLSYYLGPEVVFNPIFARERDIFKPCMLEQSPMRKLIIEGLFTSIRKLELYLMLNVPIEGILMLQIQSTQQKRQGFV